MKTNILGDTKTTEDRMGGYRAAKQKALENKKESKGFFKGKKFSKKQEDLSGKNLEQ